MNSLKLISQDEYVMNDGNKFETFVFNDKVYNWVLQVRHGTRDASSHFIRLYKYNPNNDSREILDFSNPLVHHVIPSEWNIVVNEHGFISFSSRIGNFINTSTIDDERFSLQLQMMSVNPSFL